MKNYCSNCGKESSAEAKFCPDCGKELSAAGNKIIGWYKQSVDHFLCTNCFAEEKNINKDDYQRKEKDSLKESIYTCDKCGKEINIGAEKTHAVTKKKRNSFLTWFLVVVIGIVFFPLVSTLLKQTPTPVADTLKDGDNTPTGQATYVEIAKFSGNGGKNTDSFTLNGGTVKLIAKTWGGTKGIGTYSSFSVNPDKGSISLGNDIIIQAKGDEVVEDYTIIRNLRQDSYYVWANSGVSWEVTVLEAK